MPILYVCIGVEHFIVCISLPPWILSVYFWNNERGASLFVFLHQNRARVTEESSSLAGSGFYRPCSPCAVDSKTALAVHKHPMMDPLSRGDEPSWFYCYQNHALALFIFPTFLGRSELFVP